MKEKHRSMNFNTYSSHRKTILKREMAVTKTILLMIGIVKTVSVIVSDIWRLKVCWPHYLTIAIMSFFVLIWKITRKILSVNEKQLVKQVNKYKTDVTIIINKKSNCFASLTISVNIQSSTVFRHNIQRQTWYLDTTSNTTNGEEIACFVACQPCIVHYTYLSCSIFLERLLHHHYWLIH